MKDCMKKSKVNPLEKSPRRKRGVKNPPNSPTSPKSCSSKGSGSCSSKEGDLLKSPRSKSSTKMDTDQLVKSPRTRSGKSVPQKYDLTRPPISPRRPKPSLVIRKPKRAVNLCNIYERPNKETITKESSILETKEVFDFAAMETRESNNVKESKQDFSILEETEKVINEVHKEAKPFSEKNVTFSCVSMRCDEGDLDLPPPPVIRRTWKKAQVASGYKLFCPDSPAKAAYSPHLLSVKLCFMRGLDDGFDSTIDSKSFELPSLPQREFKSKRSLIR